jgi:hypothetical protein
MNEIEVVEQLNKMATESLDPETFDKWRDVLDMLISNRKYLSILRDDLP